MADNTIIAEQPTNPPASLGRYILLALAFVLLFVGVAFLAYRLTRRAPNPTTQASPAPTTAAASFIPAGFALPAPKLPPTNPNKYRFVDQNAANAVIVKRGVSGQTISQDGFGNLLFDNLTHAEHAAIEQARINADLQLKLAQERNHGSLTSLQETNQATLGKQKQQNQFQLSWQDKDNATQLALRQKQNDLELARLQTQIRLANIQNRQQPTQVNQERLAELQLAFQKQQAEQQRLTLLATGDAQLALQQNQADNQLALQKNQFDNQNQLLANQTLARVGLAEQQNNFNLSALTLRQKQQLTEDYLAAALHIGDQDFSLTALEVQALLRPNYYQPYY